MMNLHSNFIRISIAGVIALSVTGCGEKNQSVLTDAENGRLALLDKEPVKKKKVVKEKPTEAVEVKVAEVKPEVPKEVIDKAMVAGKASYANCMACHQPTGAGIPGVFPPLAKSNWVNDLEAKELAKIVIRGLQGEVEVNGTKYASVMAPLAAVMNDQQISDVLVYVKNSWGNTGGYISPEQVKEVRDEHVGKPMLTAAEIEGIDSLK